MKKCLLILTIFIFTLALADGLRFFPEDFTIEEQRDIYKTRAEYFEARTKELEDRYEPLNSMDGEVARHDYHEIFINIKQIEGRDKPLSKRDVFALSEYKKQLNEYRQKILSDLSEP